jgi:hypothetical protein
MSVCLDMLEVPVTCFQATYLFVVPLNYVSCPFPYGRYYITSFKCLLLHDWLYIKKLSGAWKYSRLRGFFYRDSMILPGNKQLDVGSSYRASCANSYCRQEYCNYMYLFCVLYCWTRLYIHCLSVLWTSPLSCIQTSDSLLPRWGSSPPFICCVSLLAIMYSNHWFICCKLGFFFLETP